MCGGWLALVAGLVGGRFFLSAPNSHPKGRRSRSEDLIKSF
jgi:hypothetical protein